MKQHHYFYYGIIFYCFVLMFFIFAIIKSLHSLFLVPVTESLQMGRSDFSLIFTISGLSVAIALPMISKLLRKYSAKLIISCSIFMVAGGFSAYALASKSWHFYLIALVVGAGTAGCTNMVASLLINNWFEDRKGFALGVAFTGSGFGAALISPIMTKLLAEYGWQFSYVFWGSVIGIICLPLTWLLAYQKPAERGVLPYRQEQKAKVVNQTVSETGFLLQDIKTKSFFWLYLAAMFFWSLALGGVHIHIPAYLTDLGHSASFVAFIYSAQAVCLIGGKLVLGVIFDEKGSRAGILFMASTFLLALICLFLSRQSVLAILFALLYGCGSTFTSVGIPYLAGSFFGQRNYAEILSIVNMVYVLGAALGPFISGKMYDITGGYVLIWKIELVLFVLSVILLLYLKNYLEKQSQKGLK